MQSNNNAVLFILTVSVLASFTGKAMAACENPIAKVASAQGAVRVQPYGSRHWHDIRKDDTLCPGDMLHTSRLSRVTIIRPGGVGLYLDQNTTIMLNKKHRPECGEGLLFSLRRGLMYIRGRKPDCYDVQTPYVNAVHKGTEFLVAVDDNKAEITVYDGQVSGESGQGKVDVKPGQKVIAEAGKPIKVAAAKVTPEDAVQWALYYPPVIDLGTGRDQLQAQAEVAKQLPAVRPEPVEGLNQRFGFPNNSFAPAINAYRQGNISNAIAELDKLPQGQQAPAYLTLRAGLLLTVGRVDEAEPLIAQALQKQPNDPDALALQAIIAVTKNRQQQALELANQAVTNNPGSSTALIALSYAQQSLFKLEDAVKSTKKATRLSPNNALAWARLSELELSQGGHKQALKAAKQAQQLNPKLSRTQTVLGFADLAETEITQAKQQFQQALTLDSTDPLARLGLGLAKIRQGDVEDGKNELETAANLDPGNAIIRSYLGKAYYELRNQDYAATEYGIAKKLDPKDPTPYFYDAIKKQTENRPIEALQDIQKAYELNDNRGVYRSKLVLDEDKAIRSASMGRIYKELGFDDVARWQATNSLNEDPGNYSAHRLFADSYLYRPRQEIARASEVLQAQLLQPLNYYSAQPQLAYSDLNIPKSAGFADAAFNEYTRIYEGNHDRLTATGLFGSNDTKADEAVLSGIHDKFAYSLGQLHYQNDGFRPNAGLNHDLYNALLQYQITPDFSVQAEYRHRESENGDIQMKGDMNNFDSSYRRKLKQDTYRFGSIFNPNNNSSLLLSFAYADRTEKVNQKLGPIDVTALSNNGTYQLESQYLFNAENFNVTLGGGTFQSDVSTQVLPRFPGIPDLVKNQNGQSFGYLYTNTNLLKNLVATLGFSYDNFHTDQAGGILTINQLSPKFGLQWKVNKALSFRLAGFQSVKPPIVINQTIQPMQIAGFNQFYDDINGTRSTQYGIGMDSKPFDNMFVGLEALKRDLETPINSLAENKASAKTIKVNEELYRLYFNWIINKNWLFNSEFRFENIRGNPNNGIPDQYETAYLPINIRYFNESGFFVDVGGQFVHQTVSSRQNEQFFNHFKFLSFDTSFFLVDAAIGYRFPKRYGLISFEAKNLLDKQIRYVDRSFQMNEFRSSDLIPERLLYARITFNF